MKSIGSFRLREIQTLEAPAPIEPDILATQTSFTTVCTSTSGSNSYFSASEWPHDAEEGRAPKPSTLCTAEAGDAKSSRQKRDLSW